MLEFLKNWLFRRILNNHRMLFRYWNGIRYVSADPFVITRAMLNTTTFDVENDLKKINIPDARVISSTIEVIAKGVREIFSIPPFEKGGLTELECISLLFSFNDFMDRVKKNGALNPISSQPMAMSSQEKSLVEKNDMSENSVSG